MKTIQEKHFEGERSLFKERDAKIIDSVFENGESPLKESRHIKLQNTIFRWK